MPLELPVHKRALIVGAVSPLELAVALLLALEELPRVLGPAPVFSPDLLSVAMLRVVQPLSAVPHTLGGIEEGPTARGFVVGPLAYVDVTIRLGHLSLALEEALSELPFELSSIWVELHSEAVFFVSSHRPRNDM